MPCKELALNRLASAPRTAWRTSHRGNELPMLKAISQCPPECRPSEQKRLAEAADSMSARPDNRKVLLPAKATRCQSQRALPIRALEEKTSVDNISCPTCPVLLPGFH